MRLTTADKKKVQGKEVKTFHPSACPTGYGIGKEESSFWKCRRSGFKVNTQHLSESKTTRGWAS